MIIFDLFVITVLILINSFYVAAEFSSVSVKRAGVRRLAEEGKLLAVRLLPYIEDRKKLDEFIAATQIGITWSSLIVGAYGQARIATRLAPVIAEFGTMDAHAALAAASISVLVILSFFHIVLGELIPKTLAMQYPTTVGLVVIYPMIVSMRVYTLFTAFLNGSGWALLRLLRIPMEEGYRHIHSPDEIVHMLKESREAGLIEPREHKRLIQVLNLSERIVSDLMIPLPAVFSIPVSTSTTELLSIITESPYTRIPVFRSAPDDVIGFIHTRDVVRIHAEGKLESLEQMLYPGLQVRAQLSVERLLTLMREYRSHMAFVTDLTGATIGLITLDDLLKEFFGKLPEEMARR